MNKYQNLLERMKTNQEEFQEFGGMRNSIDDGEECDTPVEEIDAKLEELDKEQVAILKEANISESTMELLDLVSDEDALKQLKIADKGRAKGVLHLSLAA